MSRSSKAAGPAPEVRSGLLFQEMDHAQELGDYIAAGRAQRKLERLGWLIRRIEPKDEGDDRPAVDVPEPTEADGEDLADEDVEADEDRNVAAADRPLGLGEVVRLVGVTLVDLEEAIELGRFPLPDGYISARPYWERGTIGWWVKRGQCL
jgi:hypothetical protein